MIEKFLSFINNYLVIYVKVLPYCLNFLYKHFIKYSFLLNILLILENIAYFASKWHYFYWFLCFKYLFFLSFNFPGSSLLHLKS